jgi:hypothetical protein
MILADAGINVIILAIAGIVALVRWFTTKDEEAPPTSEQDAPRRQATAGPSEDERMRRFLEALGVPTEGQVPPPRNRPAARTAEPPPLKAPQNYPAPTVAHRKDFRRTPPIVVVPPPIPVERPSFEAAPPPVPPAREMYDSELHLPEVKEYVTASSTASSDREVPATWRHESAVLTAAPVGEQWRHLLRSPRDLRTAIVMREILGPPRSLQTGGALSTLP